MPVEKTSIDVGLTMLKSCGISKVNSLELFILYFVVYCATRMV